MFFFFCHMPRKRCLFDALPNLLTGAEEPLPSGSPSTFQLYFITKEPPDPDQKSGL